MATGNYHFLSGHIDFVTKCIVRGQKPQNGNTQPFKTPWLSWCPRILHNAHTTSQYSITYKCTYMPLKYITGIQSRKFMLATIQFVSSYVQEIIL